MSDEKVDAIEAILDENNTENVVLYNSDNEAVEFEQIAVIPLEDKDYVILKPVEPLEGMKDDEALVFAIEEDENEDDVQLVLEQDEEVIDEVFNVYDKLFEETVNNNNNN
ncbi:MAG: DUF1292 domain-containing protein, partial [Christensenellales bacterium]